MDNRISRDARAQAADYQRGDCSAANSSDINTSTSTHGRREHYGTQHARPFQCPEPDCGACFLRKFSLHEHIKRHTGEKPFQCDVESCGRRFSTSGNMLRHRRLHTLRRFQCPEAGCPRVYTTQEKLARHFRVHMGSAAYPCTVTGCAKSFATSGNLARHMGRNHRQDPLRRALNKQRFSVTNTAQQSPTAVESDSCIHSGGVYLIAPITCPGLPSDAITEQDLFELLECLFVDEPTALIRST